MSVWMSLIEFSLTMTMRGMREATRACMRDERVPATDRPALAPARCLVHLEHAVTGDRVVQGDERRELAFEQEHAVAEALVVVDDVEVADTGCERPQGAEAERQRLGERAGRELHHLDEVLALFSSQ